jgi:hypothetical protein
MTEHRSDLDIRKQMMRDGTDKKKEKNWKYFVKKLGWNV